MWNIHIWASFWSSKWIKKKHKIRKKKWDKSVMVASRCHQANAPSSARFIASFFSTGAAASTFDNYPSKIFFFFSKSFFQTELPILNEIWSLLIRTSKAKTPKTFLSTKHQIKWNLSHIITTSTVKNQDSLVQIEV